MNRALVIKTYGDQEVCGAIVDGMTRTITPVDQDEMAALRAEIEQLRAENEIRSYGASKRFERAEEELMKKYQPQRENPLKWAILAVWTLLWLAIYVICELMRYGMKARQQHNKDNRERYRWYRERGICTVCGRQWVEPGHVRCNTCYAKMNACLERTREQRNAYKAARRKALIEQGLCTECGKRPATEGMRMCSRCRDMRNDSTRKYKIQQRTKRRMSNGNRHDLA